VLCSAGKQLFLKDSVDDVLQLSELLPSSDMQTHQPLDIPHSGRDRIKFPYLVSLTEEGIR
jgi:hypothetical protein